jgi:hypothetical protein
VGEWKGGSAFSSILSSFFFKNLTSKFERRKCMFRGQGKWMIFNFYQEVKQAFLWGGFTVDCGACSLSVFRAGQMDRVSFIIHKSVSSEEST